MIYVADHKKLVGYNQAVYIAMTSIVAFRYALLFQRLGTILFSDGYF